MADDNKNTAGTENDTGAQNNDGTQNTGGSQNTGGAQDDKKYTETDMNNISKKNSEKAVAKLLKELGITDKEKAKQILAKAAEDEKAAAAAAGTADSEANAQLTSQLAEAQQQANNAVLENILLVSKVKPEKVARAVRLVDPKDCLDEDGAFSREKAETAVKALLKDWPELTEQADGSAVGFSIGGDGKQGGDNKSGAAKKSPAQKSWNRFNY